MQSPNDELVYKRVRHSTCERPSSLTTWCIVVIQLPMYSTISHHYSHITTVSVALMLLPMFSAIFNQYSPITPVSIALIKLPMYTANLPSLLTYYSCQYFTHSIAHAKAISHHYSPITPATYCNHSIAHALGDLTSCSPITPVTYFHSFLLIILFSDPPITTHILQ